MLSEPKPTASNRHGKGISRERQSKQQRAYMVETNPISLRTPAINGQMALGEKESQETERDVDKKDCPPTESSDQNTTERWTECGANRGHRSEQSHSAAGSFLRNRFTDKRQGEGHHDGRSKPLQRPGGNQEPERRRDTAQNRGCCEQEDSGQQQSPMAGDVTEPSDTDDQSGDGEEIGEDDPLDILKRCGERLRQRRQGNIGDAGAERGQQHG